MRNERNRPQMMYERLPELSHMRMPPPSDLPPGFGGFGGKGQDEERAQSLWSLIDDRMRGRWKWMAIIGCCLALLFGIVGFLSAEPMFEGTGAVLITPRPGVVMHQTMELDSLQTNYEKMVATHVQLMKQPRCLDEALADEELAKLPWAQQPSARKMLKKNLNVDADRNSELIHVRFESPDPVVAQTVTNAVLRAYWEMYGKYGTGDLTTTLDELRDHAKKYQREQDSLRAQQQQIISKYDNTELNDLQKSNTARIALLQQQIAIGKRAIARQSDQKPKDGQPGPGRVLPSLEQLERFNSTLALYRQRRDVAQAEFDEVKNRNFPGTTQYEDKKQNALDAQRLFEEEYEKTIRNIDLHGADVILTDKGAEVLRLDDIPAVEKELAALQERQQTLVADLAEISDLKFKQDQNEKELVGVQNRLATLETESKKLSSVIKIAGWSARPDEPSDDARKKRAVMGIGMGFMASFGAFFLLGTIDRRAFGASQLSGKPGSEIPMCLGVLPDLGATLNDPESSDVASHCVHQIRNQIEALREPGAGYVLAVTSPHQGDGKTSIVMALGWSYAAAGYNTLLIDCDMVGRSLTRQLGLIGREGLRDALMARELNGSVSRMPVEHLSAVPVGVDNRFGPENVRRADLEALIDQVRGLYDIILIDTGPMLGSLESTPVTAAADGVVLSVRRGRSRSKLDDCVSKLELFGTRCLGVILNCAVRSDCNRYVSEASLAAAEEDRVARSESGSRSAVVPDAPGERNALVRAMQTSTRSRLGI